jgi:hypothetical protein
VHNAPQSLAAKCSAERHGNTQVQKVCEGAGGITDLAYLEKNIASFVFFCLLRHEKSAQLSADSTRLHMSGPISKVYRRPSRRASVKRVVVTPFTALFLRRRKNQVRA